MQYVWHVKITKHTWTKILLQEAEKSVQWIGMNISCNQVLLKTFSSYISRSCFWDHNNSAHWKTDHMRGCKHINLTTCDRSSNRFIAKAKASCVSISFPGLCITLQIISQFKEEKKAHGSKQLLASLLQQLCASASVRMHVSGFSRRSFGFPFFPCQESKSLS